MIDIKKGEKSMKITFTKTSMCNRYTTYAVEADGIAVGLMHRVEPDKERLYGYRDAFCLNPFALDRETAHSISFSQDVRRAFKKFMADRRMRPMPDIEFKWIEREYLNPRGSACIERFAASVNGNRIAVIEVPNGRCRLERSLRFSEDYFGVYAHPTEDRLWNAFDRALERSEIDNSAKENKR